MGSGQAVAVYGAYGHTGRFVVAQLLERGFIPVLSGRDADKLKDLAASHPGLDVRPASVDDPASLDRALAGAAAVVNCAGPFATTAAPVIEAALRAGIPYVDVAAEIEANADTFTHFTERARAAGVAVVPAMAFYGVIEQLLTGWIFDLLPQGEDELQRAKWVVIETVCGGLETSAVSDETSAGNRLLR